MTATFNNILKIITTSSIAYILVVCILKLNGFKMRNDSKIPLSKIIKRLLFNLFLWKIISEKFEIYTIWYDYSSYVNIIWLAYAISFIATITPIIITSKKKTIFNALSIDD